MTYTIEEARQIIANAGYIGKVTASGLGIAIYEGDEAAPGTWMEIGRLAIQDGQVSSAALQLELM